MTDHDTEAPPMPSSQSLFASTAAATGGSITWLLTTILKHGPSWDLVPPLLFSAASLTGAVVAYKRAQVETRVRELQAAQEMRHRDEIHALKMDAERRRIGESPGSA